MKPKFGMHDGEMSHHQGRPDADVSERAAVEAGLEAHTMQRELEAEVETDKTTEDTEGEDDWQKYLHDDDEEESAPTIGDAVAASPNVEQISSLL